MGSKWLQTLIFFLFGILCYFVLQSIFYDTIYHSDNLYLPLFVKDFLSCAGVHWYLPPSNYFFPDLVLMSLLSLFLPEVALPASFGIFQMFLLLSALFYFLKNEIGKHKSLLALNLFLFLIVLSILIDNAIPSKLNPFVYLFTNGHHISSILVCLVVLTFIRKGILNSKILLGWMIFMLILASASDQFLFLYFLPFVYLPLRNQDRKWILFSLILIVLISESIRFAISSSYHIPENQNILMDEIQSRDALEIWKIFFRYYYDFCKIYLSRVNLFFQFSVLLACILIFRIRSHARLRNSLFLFGISSFFFLGVIGRFGFPHPFPIRYIFPFLFFTILYGLILLIKRFWIFPPNAYFKFQCILLFFISPSFLYLSLDGSLDSEKDEYREQFLSYLEERTEGKPFWTSYEAEKKIRFWSQGKLNPLPCGPNGKPYLWITGAFPKTSSTLSHCPIPGQIYWVPNSLTKDF